MTEAERSDTGGQATARINPDVVSRRVGDEVVLVNLKTNRIFTLSPTGSRFWELFEAGSSRPEIEDQLLAEFDVGREDLSREIDELLDRLRQAQIVGEDAG